MAVKHHTIKADMLRHGHLLYTGGSGNYVLVATATPNSTGQIEVTSYNGEIPEPGTVIYRLDPDSVSAMIPLPVQLSATQWEIVINCLNDRAEELGDGVDCTAPPATTTRRSAQTTRTTRTGRPTNPGSPRSYATRSDGSSQATPPESPPRLGRTQLPEPTHAHPGLAPPDREPGLLAELTTTVWVRPPTRTPTSRTHAT